jgi:hypothetical protein
MTPAVTLTTMSKTTVSVSSVRRTKHIALGGDPQHVDDVLDLAHVVRDDEEQRRERGHGQIGHERGEHEDGEEDEEGVDDAGDGALGARADVRGRAGDGAGRGEAAEERARRCCRCPARGARRRGRAWCRRGRRRRRRRGATRWLRAWQSRRRRGGARGSVCEARGRAGWPAGPGRFHGKDGERRELRECPGASRRPPRTRSWLPMVSTGQARDRCARGSPGERRRRSDEGDERGGDRLCDAGPEEQDSEGDGADELIAANASWARRGRARRRVEVVLGHLRRCEAEEVLELESANHRGDAGGEAGRHRDTGCTG